MHDIVLEEAVLTVASHPAVGPGHRRAPTQRRSVPSAKRQCLWEAGWSTRSRGSPLRQVCMRALRFLQAATKNHNVYGRLKGLQDNCSTLVHDSRGAAAPVRAW